MITQSNDPRLRGYLIIIGRCRSLTVRNDHRLKLLLNLSVLAAIIVSANVDALATKRPQASKEVKRSYKGISFEYTTGLAREIQAKVVAETLDGKPGDVEPRHVALDLIGYQMPHPSSFMGAPRVRVFPIDRYRSLIVAYSQEMTKSTIPPANYAPDFDDQIITLKTLLAKRPSSETIDIVLTQGRSDYYRGRLPLLPMYDVCEAFRSHVQYLNFKNGSGVAFITQYTMGSTLIVNQALSFNFPRHDR